MIRMYAVIRGKFILSGTHLRIFEFTDLLTQEYGTRKGGGPNARTNNWERK